MPHLQNKILRFAFLLLLVSGINVVRAQGLTILSGNGQIVQEQFVSTAPLVVQFRDASGKPVSGAAITWTVTQGMGTLLNQMFTTDVNGQASSNFRGNVQPGNSMSAATVTASSAAGSVKFVVTTVLLVQSSGRTAAPPAVELLSPPLENRNLKGRAGAILPAAVVVRVTIQSGPQQGQPVPNVGIRILNGDPTLPSPASCNGPAGLVLTDTRGVATCDLVLGSGLGFFSATALAGESLNTAKFFVQIDPGVPCTFSLSQPSQTVGSGNGAGSLNVTAASGCGWTATSNANWIAISTGLNGNGNGTVSYSIAANPGAARTGTLLIAGQTVTVNQAASNPALPNPLGIAIGPNLPAAVAGAAYTTTLVATGGMPPYTWFIDGGLPPGLTLNASTGILSGTPTNVASYTFAATVKDTAGAVQSLSFSLAVGNTSGPASAAIVNPAFPNGVVGQPYRQLLISAGGCITPFTPPPVFSLTGGSLPNGLILQANVDGSYSIAGTPNTLGTFNFTIAVRALCGSATKSFTINIGATPPSSQPLNVNPAALVFTVQQGLISQQTAGISTNGPPLNFAASATTSDGAQWLSVISATPSTPGALSVIVSTSALSVGSYSGAIVIISNASNNPVTIPVTLTVTAAPAFSLGSTALAFNYQSDGAPPAPQIIGVTSTSTPLDFSTIVTTTSGVNWLFVSPTSGKTPGALTVLVSPIGLPQGSHNGTITIGSPNAPTVTIPVSITISRPEQPLVTSVKNAASFAQGPIAPGEWITIFGSGIGPQIGATFRPTPVGFVDTTLAETRVFFDDIPAPVVYASSVQVSAIVPYGLTGRTNTHLQVEYRGVRSEILELGMADSMPALFTLDPGGRGQGAILNQDQSFNSPQNGAETGKIISLFATGEGQTDPFGIDGKLAADTSVKPVLAVSAQIAGLPAEVTYAGAAPGLPAGIMQVNVRVPDAAPRGVPAPVVINVGDNASQPGVTLFVRP